MKLNGCFFTDDVFLEYCNNIWNKVFKSSKKELDSKPISYNKFFKAKLRSGRNPIAFHGKDVPDVGFDYICLPVTLIDCTLEKVVKYYLKVILKCVNTLCKEKDKYGKISWWRGKFFSD